MATALKHRSAGQTPDVRGDGGRSVGRFLVATAQHPLWLAGVGADVGGLGLQVAALHLGPLAVVQPLMITALLASLVLNHKVARTKVSKREVGGGAVLALALIGFLAISGASSPRITGPMQTADGGAALALGVASLGTALLCLVAARRASRVGAAALLGIAAGVTYACTAALIKYTADLALSAGPLAVLSSWQLYVLVGAGAAGLVFSQLAFQAGPLRASLPVISTVDPLLSIALGVLVYDEHLRPGPGAAVGEIGCLVALCGAAVYLGRIRGVQDATERADALGAP
ncbi:MAG: DMT family transporter [Mycobacteriales bacterium]